MTGKREIDVLLAQDREWLDPPTNIMARPIEVPPMVPIKDASDDEEVEG